MIIDEPILVVTAMYQLVTSVILFLIATDKNAIYRKTSIAMCLICFCTFLVLSALIIK